jgi:hypothetical protein
MSPEQASGSPDLGPRSDLYSLGVVGYAMLSGRLPFSGRTPGEVLVKRLTSEAPPPAISSGDVSASLVEAVMKCLAKDPGRRWPDSAAFARAVASFDDEESGPLEGLGLLTTFFCFAGIVLHVGWRIAEKPGLAFELLGKIVPAIAVIVLLALVGSVAWAARRGSASAALLQAFREPPVWYTWYPQGLRRRGNVWNRLPEEIRRLRLGLGLMIAAGVLVLGPMVVYMAAHPNPPDWVRGSRVVKRIVGVTGTALVGSMAIWLLMAWRIPERLRRKGLTESEARRFAYEAPLSRATFWSRPSVEALLEDAAARAADPAAGSTDHLDTLTMGSGSDIGRRRRD